MRVVDDLRPSMSVYPEAWGANTRSRGNLVLVDESTQEISSPDVRHDAEAVSYTHLTLPTNREV